MDQGYTFNVDTNRQLIEIVAEPTVTFSSLVASQKDIEQQVQEHGLCKVLIDAREMEESPSLPEYMSFGKGLLDSPTLRLLRYALVGAPTSRFQMQLMRGFTRKLDFAVDLFDSREKALVWLDEED